MTPEEWKYVFEQTGIGGVCITVFIVGLRRRWWVMGSDYEYVRSIADRFMNYVDRLIAQKERDDEARSVKRSDE